MSRFVARLLCAGIIGAGSLAFAGTAAAAPSLEPAAPNAPTVGPVAVAQNCGHTVDFFTDCFLPGLFSGSASGSLS